MTVTLAPMPPKKTGSIETHPWRDGRTITYRLRVRDQDGQRHRVDLGTNHEGWNPERAQVELDEVMARIERGTWEPPERRPAAAREFTGEETFHEFGSVWWAEKKPTLSTAGANDYEHRLQHLFAYFKNLPVCEFNARQVDKYRAHKLQERDQLQKAWETEQQIARREKRKPKRPTRRPLSSRTINMQLELLAQILDRAVDYGLLDANPARGKNRRLKAEKQQRSFLEADMVVSLFDAAGARDKSARLDQRLGRRAMFATMTLAGLRVSEICDLRIGHLDLQNGRLRVTDSKTQAGIREVELTLWALDELRAHLANLERDGFKTGPRAYAFGTWKGGRRDPNRLRDRLLGRSVEDADAQRMERGVTPMPERVTPHALRRTYVSLALAAGRDPRWVMHQIGHTDPALTLRVYAQVMKRQHIDHALIWELMRFPGEADVRPNGRDRGGSNVRSSDPTIGPMFDSGPSGTAGRLPR